MSIKEQIRAEIERQMKYYEEKEMREWDEQNDEDALWHQGHRKMCSKLLSFLDSLPEQEHPIYQLNQILLDWVREAKTDKEQEARFEAHKRFFELYDEYMVQEPEQPVKSLPEWKWVKPDKQYPVGITREMDVNGDWQYCMSSGRLYESCQYLSLAELELKSVDAGPFPILEDENAADKKAVKEIVKTVHKEVTRQVKEMVKEQPVLPGIDEEGIPGRDFIPVEWVDACEKYGRWKIVQKEQPASEGLEKAAKEYATKWHKRPDGSEWKSIYPAGATRDFIAGAEWGMNQCPLPEDTTIFLKGVAEGKRLMMDEAVEGTIVCYPDKTYSVESCLFNNKKHHKSGDKVKVIVIKEED